MSVEGDNEVRRHRKANFVKKTPTPQQTQKQNETLIKQNNPLYSRSKVRHQELIAARYQIRFSSDKKVA